MPWNLESSPLPRGLFGFCAAILVLGFSGTSSRAALVVSEKPTKHVQCAAGVCMPDAARGVLNVDDLAALLSTGDVRLSSGSIAQDIEINAALSWVSTSRLTLDSYRSVTFNKPVVVAGTGALTITTNDGGTGGDYRFLKKGHVEFWDLSSHLTINAAPCLLIKGLKKLARALRHPGCVALSRDHNAAKDGVYAHSLAEGARFFEGLGNVISNLSISDATGFQVALFTQIGIFDLVRDLGLKDVNIAATGNNQTVGSLVGSSSGAITNCYATGQVSGGPNSYVGGLVGGNAGGTVGRSFSSVTVLGGNGSTVGGLVGVNQSAFVEQSYAAGAVAGGDGSSVGGLVGKNDSGDSFLRGIYDSYATGAVTGGNNASVGGLMGTGLQSGCCADIVETSYSTGAVSGGSGAFIGGSIGQDLSSPGITDTDWDLDTSGVSDPAQGAGNVQNDPGITGLTDAELKSALPAGFDPAIWGQRAAINGGHPYLLANLPK